MNKKQLLRENTELYKRLYQLSMRLMLITDTLLNLVIVPEPSALDRYMQRVEKSIKDAN